MVTTSEFKGLVDEVFTFAEGLTGMFGRIAIEGVRRVADYEIDAFAANMAAKYPTLIAALPTSPAKPAI